jgi:hypothetical protein
VSLYDRFSELKEEGFREEFIRPLLIRMGYIGISNKHGVNEFGKDFVFSEIDNFGQLRHLAIQAKHEKVLNQGKIIDDLISQVKQCFEVPYSLPSSPNEVRYVSTVFVFNTGNITDNAITQLCSALPKAYASNVRFFAGQYLETLSRSINFKHSNELRGRIEALRRQLAFNISIWSCTINGIDPGKKFEDQKFDYRQPIMNSVSQFLSEPFLWEYIDYKDAERLWRVHGMIQNAQKKYFLFTTRPPQSHTDKEIEQIELACTDAIQIATRLSEQCLFALKKLPSVCD